MIFINFKGLEIPPCPPQVVVVLAVAQAAPQDDGSYKHDSAGDKAQPYKHDTAGNKKLGGVTQIILRQWV